MRSRLFFVVTTTLLLCCNIHADSFTQTNLVSDGSVSSINSDPNLINPWGLVSSSSSPFWVADNGSGHSTLYRGDGSKVNLVVTIPNPLDPMNPSHPTGIVFNNSSAFNGDLFIFATEDGTIAGWRGALGTSAETLSISGSGASYTGLAIGSFNMMTTIYAVDRNSGGIEAYDGPGHFATLPGHFTDPNLPGGYRAFNIQNINGLLYVTYTGAGPGIIDVFNLDGTLNHRFTTDSHLNDAWGLALAPLTFGNLKNDLLVGNFGDGRINAFDSTTGAWVDTFKDGMGNDIVNESLWGLAFGNGANNTDMNTLYFTAGLHNEEHGLFGSLTDVPGTNGGGGGTGSVPEPSSVALFVAGIAGLTVRRLR